MQTQDTDPVSSAQGNNFVDSKIAELTGLLQADETTSDLNDLAGIENQFRIGLMENISEGAIFLDHQKKITGWNRSAEIITGLTSANMLNAEFNFSLLGVNFSASDSVACPIAQSQHSGRIVAFEHGIVGRSGREIQIELSVIPVTHAGVFHGNILLLKDLTVNSDLKRELTDLKTTSSVDPLTGVYNRDTFEKNLREYMQAHRSTNTNCCLIVGDIDFFKKVNDTYGHNVGDQALVQFAQTLKQFVRSRDVVARYGGEEFVILCANCDLAHAVERAEKIRLNLAQTPLQMLDGKTLSASFGVSELNDDDDITTFLSGQIKLSMLPNRAGATKSLPKTI